MSEQLYRQVPGPYRMRKPHPDAFWSDKYGWLEPAGIDYEALALALAEDWDPVLDDAMGAPEEHSEYLKLAHRYAAALGIGDTDE